MAPFASRMILPRSGRKSTGSSRKATPKFCELCHDSQTSCEECHRKNPPQDHTITWRRKSHGLRATWGRERCAACHEEDSCLRCHQHNAPQSHHGGWGPPSERHCLHATIRRKRPVAPSATRTSSTMSAEPSPHDLGLFPPRCAPCHPFNNPSRAAPAEQHRAMRCLSLTACGTGVGTAACGCNAPNRFVTVLLCRDARAPGAGSQPFPAPLISSDSFRRVQTSTLKVVRAMNRIMKGVIEPPPERKACIP